MSTPLGDTRINQGWGKELNFYLLRVPQGAVQDFQLQSMNPARIKAPT